MIQTRKLFVVATLVATSVAMAAKDGSIVLRKSLRQGIESYHLETTQKQTISIPGAGDQDMNITSVSAYSYKIGTVDATAGLAPIDVTTKVEKFDADGPMADLMAGQKDKILVTTTSSGKLDARNRFTADPTKKLDPRAVLNGTATSSIFGPFIEFPEKGINIGDTWDVTIHKGPTTNKEDQKITAKLVGEKDLDGKAVYIVSLSGSFNTDINLGEILKANPNPDLEALGTPNMLLKGSTELSGELLVDKATGQTVLLTLKMTTKQQAELPDQNLSIPSTGTATIKLSLDK